MRDSGLDEAIHAVGGVTELARRIGIAQPSVSAWERIPADRVIAVETVTGVPRVRLRPDLYADGPPNGIDEIEIDRARQYALLAALLSKAPTQALLDRIAALRGDATPLGMALMALGDAAARTTAEAVEREYFDLFVGLGRGELLPYASYYLTGFLNERPLARLREDLAVLGIERADGNCEPEDHAATLCETMSGLASGHFAAPRDAQRRLFSNHIAPWMGRMFADMECAPAAKLYRHVGAVGRMFLEIETEAFTLAE